MMDDALRFSGYNLVKIGAGHVRRSRPDDVADTARECVRAAREASSNPSSESGITTTRLASVWECPLARGFVEAMGGTIAAGDTPGGGFTVVVGLGCPARIR